MNHFFLIPKQRLCRNIAVTCILLMAATAATAAFYFLGKTSTNAAIIYMLSVVLIARYTDGYLPGIIASVIGVFCVNFVFTYPYMKLNFILEGYPVTFIGMLVISSITSTTTTHLKEKSKILGEREKLLMEAEKEKMRANLLRAISHDLRTPLTSIMGTSSVYLENPSLTESDKRSMIQNIYDDSNWLLNMVENLLSVTRIRDGKTQVSKSLEPLEEVVSESLQRFQKRLPLAVVHVTIPDEFIMIPLDVTLIEQVLINLLENAVYHANSHTPIDLNVTHSEKYVRFDVIDYGVGIPEEKINSIFDGGSLTPGGSGDSRKGMGIGLTICKTIILAHNGEIFAENHGQGARFSFTLPLGEETDEQT